MNNILENSISDVLVKPIDTAMVPKSNKVDSRTFVRLLDDKKVVANCKIYWLFVLFKKEILIFQL